MQLRSFHSFSDNMMIPLVNYGLQW